jgi:hypothetical protein
MRSTKAPGAGRIYRRALLTVGIGIAAAGGIAGASYGLTSNSGPATQAAATSKASTGSNSSGSSGHKASSDARSHSRLMRLLRRAVSGDVEIDTGSGFVYVDFDRGVVTSISSSAVTVLRADGHSVSDAITSTTHMPKRGAPGKGTNVVVISTSGKALYVFDVGRLAAGSSTGSATS